MEKSIISKNLLFTQLHFDLLSNMYQLSFDRNSDMLIIYNTITETAVKGLSLDRASIWRFVDDKLICTNIFDVSHGYKNVEGDIYKKDYPNYFYALSKGIAIVADDAKTNPYKKN